MVLGALSGLLASPFDLVRIRWGMLLQIVLFVNLLDVFFFWRGEGEEEFFFFPPGNALRWFEFEDIFLEVTKALDV